MNQHGVLTLVLSFCLLGIAEVFTSYTQSTESFGEAGVDALTICAASGEMVRKISYEKSAFNNAAALPKVVRVAQDDVTTIWLEVVPEQMKFNQDTITVKAGKKVILELDNPDGMQHNLLILKPNTLEKVGAAADAMLRDPKASEKHYVPEIPEVLFATEMLGPNEAYTLKFTAPNTPGNYPFVCTFPGHWRMMSGIMVVQKS